MLPLEMPVGGDGAAGGAADTVGNRPVHVLPRFVLLDPTAAGAAAGAAAVAAGAAAEELLPSELDRLLRAPPPR